MRIGLTVRGVVQGVGFRPSVARLAHALGLSGFVRNERGSVRIEVQGERALELADALRALPPPIRVEKLEQVTLAERAESDFVIAQSDASAAVEPALPADLATCAECAAEIEDAKARRFRYPFTNCTRCGPRFSIVEALPYDRGRTSMKRFELCADCSAEYGREGDRRFHAEAMACPACGPVLELLDSGGKRLATREEALQRAAALLRQGGILALRGLGGFQLLTDATDDEAVRRLRSRKHREEKPLAVLFESLASVRSHAELSDREERWLTSAEAPILLVQRRAESNVGGSVAPGNSRLGAMLPYTPLHRILAKAVGRPLVCTSGNRAEEPMCTVVADAVKELGEIADELLVHNREIMRPVDDSVARVGPSGLCLVRRARGFAPRPVASVDTALTVLALGANLKSTVTLLHRGQLVPSHHLGDLESSAAIAGLERTVGDLCRFFDAKPDVVCCDLHPDYASSELAARLAQELGVPLLRVQHHHAHVASALAEHDVGHRVLGFAWDGSGLGTDGTIWGGEALVADGAHAERVAHLRPFRLPGGDAAARDPRRAALGVLHAIDPALAERYANRWYPAAHAKVLLGMLESADHSRPTSSLGRLFDAVSALLGLSERSSFEGQAALELELAAERAAPQAPYPIPLGDASPAVIDWEPAVRAVLGEGDPHLAAARFHATLVGVTALVAERVALKDVVLAGGCFQNRLLADGARALLEGRGFRVLSPELVPVNDGGISVGQAFVAASVMGKS
ncbi:MAG: carbamoyltransferase [Polyangiaceae bacterium]